MAIQIRGVKIQDGSIASGKLAISGQTFDFSSGTLRAGTPSGTTDVANKAYVDAQLPDSFAGGDGISITDGAGTDTSELLDDYEEGTWSPALNNFGGSNETFIAPRYTKIGRLVTVSCQLQIGSFPSDGSTFAMSGLPYTCKNAGGTTFGTVPFRQTNSNIMGLTIGDNNTVMEMYGLDDGGGQFNYNDFGQSKQMSFVAQYETD